jgi:hypothetical protein
MIINKPLEQSEIPISPNRKTFAQDRDRVLAVYGGIFPNNIKEYAARISKRHKAKKNFAK